MKRLVAITATAGVALAGAAAPARARTGPARPAGSARPAAGAVAWSACPGGGPYLASAECARIQVPLDYRHPRGDKISIAVSRVRHTDTKHYKGVLIANPGGPGGSGLYLSGGLASWFTAVGHPEIPAQYDIVGFDPRGVGAATPALSCDAHYAAPVWPDYVPDSASAEAAWRARTKGYADACAAKYGRRLLAHMSTADTARDIDTIRAALGQKTISYYGFAYGTYLGAVYGTLFPRRVRRMVLDGNVDVRTSPYAAMLVQDRTFERNIRLFFSWIAKYDSVYHLGTTEQAVAAKYDATRAAAAANPFGDRVGPDELQEEFMTAIYNVGWYPTVAYVLAAYANDHDPGPIVALYTAYLQDTGDNGYAAYIAVEAADARWPRNWRRWHADATRLHRAGYRFYTWQNAWFNAPVASWPFRGGPAPRIRARGMAPALLVQSTLDAAAPYSGGVEMHRLLPSRLVAEIGGKTHGATLHGNACLDDKVAAYLDTGTLPENRPGDGPDATCKALPDPVPAPANAAAFRVTAGSGSAGSGSAGSGTAPGSQSNNGFTAPLFHIDPNRQNPPHK